MCMSISRLSAVLGLGICALPADKLDRKLSIVIYEASNHIVAMAPRAPYGAVIIHGIVHPSAHTQGQGHASA
jgi:hypothetical protein